jgi:hypothetical protein
VLVGVAVLLESSCAVSVEGVQLFLRGQVRMVQGEVRAALHPDWVPLKVGVTRREECAEGVEVVSLRSLGIVSLPLACEGQLSLGPLGDVGGMEVVVRRNVLQNVVRGRESDESGGLCMNCTARGCVWLAWPPWGRS